MTGQSRALGESLAMSVWALGKLLNGGGSGGGTSNQGRLGVAVMGGRVMDLPRNVRRQLVPLDRTPSVNVAAPAVQTTNACPPRCMAQP